MLEKKLIMDSVAYCGLICGMCQPEAVCSCRSNNHCGKRLSPEGCLQYTCCREKGIEGCWECEDSPCDRDMLAPDKVKIRAFVRCIREDGLESFAEDIVRKEAKGIVYHRSGIYGDYDLATEAEVLELLREG